MPEYSIGRLNGRFCLTWYRDGKRHRCSLGTNDPREAARLAPAIYAELTRPKGKSIEELWQAYAQDRAGRAVLATMRYTWKALYPRFARADGDTVTVADCRAHTEQRRQAGIADGTIHTELGHLRMVLRWAEKQGLITHAPHIERPNKSKPVDKFLTRAEVRALMDAATMPHVRLFIELAITTGGRSGALLDLTWDRVDFERGQIDLRNPFLQFPHKGRAVVPMNRTLRSALLVAKEGTLTPFVIEWAGQRVRSVKRGLARSAKRAGLDHVSPHTLRRSAARHMVEAGVPISEVAQYLGHTSEKVTFSTYGRFSVDYLKRAAAALEYDDLAMAKRGGHGRD